MEARTDEFVIQAREHLTVLEQVLLSLEKPGDPADDRERLDGCLRLVHSLKGDAGFLGFTAIRTLANAMETVLEAARDQDGPVSAAVIERLLMARDRLATLIDDLDNSHAADLREILAQLEQLEPSPAGVPQSWDIDLRQLDGARSARIGDLFAKFERCGVVSDPRILLAPHDLRRELPRGSIRFQARLSTSMSVEAILRHLGLPTSSAKVQAENDVSLSIDLGEWVRASRRSLGALLADLEQLGNLEDPRLDLEKVDLKSMLPTGPILLRGRLRTSLTSAEVDHRLRLPRIEGVIELRARASTDTGAAALPPPGPESRPVTAAGPAPDARPHAHHEDKTTSLRINVELLDRLMTLVGELTLIRNQSLLACDQDDGPLRPIVQRLGAVTSSLQETEDTDAAGRQSIRKVPAGGSRPWKATRKAGRGDDHRPGGRTRQDDPGAPSRSPHASGPQ
jgi:two-component system, chemotaxis family, sensor kinase CheA